MSDEKKPENNPGAENNPNGERKPPPQKPKPEPEPGQPHMVLDHDPDSVKKDGDRVDEKSKD